jgi:hypothetical protein
MTALSRIRRREAPNVNLIAAAMEHTAQWSRQIARLRGNGHVDRSGAQPDKNQAAALDGSVRSLYLCDSK